MHILLFLLSILLLMPTVGAKSWISCGFCRFEEECAYPRDVECHREMNGLACYRVYRNDRTIKMVGF